MGFARFCAIIIRGLGLASLCLASACAPALPASLGATSLPAATQSPSPTPLPSSTALPSATPLPTHLPPSATPTPKPLSMLCSPLEGVELPELAGMVTNAFERPRSGLDDGHHGADFAFYRHGERVGMLGLPINAVLAGRVAGVTLNRPPYGNMVIIETDLDALPDGLLEKLQPPEPVATVLPSRLTCPPYPNAAATNQRSLYLLYAHMNQTPLVQPGTTVSCGQQLGEVGTTGMSVNPHLHLEVRVGPSAVDFGSMAHYIGSASQSEMANYCWWRVSEAFQMIDPIKLFP